MTCSVMHSPHRLRANTRCGVWLSLMIIRWSKARFAVCDIPGRSRMPQLRVRVNAEQRLHPHWAPPTTGSAKFARLNISRPLARQFSGMSRRRLPLFEGRQRTGKSTPDHRLL